MADRVAAAVVHRRLTKTTGLTNKGSIFRAELYAILLHWLLFAVVKRRNLLFS